jgi:uncharacterized protein (DUF488 family)
MSICIISIGYERRTVGEFISILSSYKVVKLLDVREVPFSRKGGFSQKPLSRVLAENGIAYQHLRIAGNPHHKQRQDVKTCLSLYQAYLRENQMIVDQVIAELSQSPLAMLCYERQQACCHRGILLEAIYERGFPINIVQVEDICKYHGNVDASLFGERLVQS